MKQIILGLTLFGALTSAALADSKSSGCGLGWQVTKRMSLASSSIRATTNVTGGSTFAMTSGTSGCAKHPIAKKDEAAFRYAFENYETLKLEMAEGRGEFLDAFARTFGCGESVVGAFGTMTQSNYRAISEGTDATPFDLFENVKKQLQINPVLAAGCASA